MEIREAKKSDAEKTARVRALAVVASEAYDELDDVAKETRRFLSRIEGYLEGTYHPGASLPERAVFVAEEGGEIVGFVAGQRSTRMGCEGELQWMFVLPDQQRRGIGRALLQPMARWFVEQESRHVIIDAPPENPYRAFYLKYGASELDEYWLHWPDIESAFSGGARSG